MKKRTAIGLSALVVTILAVRATADPFPINLPPADTFVACSGSPPSGTVTHSQSCTGKYGEAATGDLSGLSARASGTALDGTQSPGAGLGGAAAITSYYFAIIAPLDWDLSLTVPVRIDAFLTSGETGTEGDFLDHSYGDAGLVVRTGNITDLGVSVCSGFCDGPGTLDGSWTLDLYALGTNEVSLSAAISLSSMLQSSASALADPYIQIDPAFLSDHPGFSLVFSDNITNSPPAGSSVPEPAAVWLLGSGLLVLATARGHINWTRN